MTPPLTSPFVVLSGAPGQTKITSIVQGNAGAFRKCRPLRVLEDLLVDVLDLTRLLGLLGGHERLKV